MLAALVLLGTLAAPPAPRAQDLPPASALAEARGLRDRALTDDTAYDVVRSLTTEVGPRSAGSPGDARAVAWALEKLRALGFQNVHAEPVTVPHWIRGELHAEITAPWPQPLVAVALGGSVATPPEGIEAEVVGVGTLEELKLLSPGQVKGRIVFFSNRMVRTLDGAGYGKAVAIRGRAGGESSKLGAVAAVIRSIGTDNDRVGHTGSPRWEAGETRIPTIALSNPDADLLERQLASGRPVRMRIRDTSAMADSAQSANVVGEIPGRTVPGECVVLGAHLDSWDLGQGANDDGAGVGTMIGAAHLIGGMKVRPKRTIRVVLFANEEAGLNGARTYARDHAAEAARIVAGMESDLGAYRPLGLASRVPREFLPAVHAMHSVLEPLGVRYEGNEAGGDADVGQLYNLGVPVFDLDTDASQYFDYHHTPNDTFDKVSPQMLRLNVACYAALAYLAAESEHGLGRAPKAGR